MQELEDEPEDVQNATPVEDQVKRGETDTVRRNSPAAGSRRLTRIDKGGDAGNSCCENKREKLAETNRRKIKVWVDEPPCKLMKAETVPRDNMSKEEYIDYLATPSRKCPATCAKKQVERRIRGTPERIEKLAKPLRRIVALNLKERSATMPPWMLENLVKLCEAESALTPEQAENLVRDRARVKKLMEEKKKKKRKKQQRARSRINKCREPIEGGGGDLDLEIVNCHYSMAQRFVRSIMSRKCTIPRQDYRDISEVILSRLSEQLEYVPVGEEDRKSQQMRLLADVFACWIAGILMQVAEIHRAELEEEIERKRREAEEAKERYFIDVDDDDDDDKKKINENDDDDDDDDDDDEADDDKQQIGQSSSNDNMDENDAQASKKSEDSGDDEDEAETEEVDTLKDQEVDTPSTAEEDREMEEMDDDEEEVGDAPSNEEVVAPQDDIAEEAIVDDYESIHSSIVPAESIEEERSSRNSIESIVDVEQQEPVEELKVDEEQQTEPMETAEIIEAITEEPEVQDRIDEIVTMREDDREEIEKISTRISQIFMTDVPFVTFAKVFDTLYSMIERETENSLKDPINNRIHRAIYEKFEEVIRRDNPALLNERMRDVIDVTSGKIANWLRKTLDEQQIKFLQDYPAEVESREVRDWSKWIVDVASMAENWSNWIHEVTGEASDIKHAAKRMTRGAWQDWSNKFESNALIWRRTYLEALHQQHHNTMMIADRKLVKTGERSHFESMYIDEKTIHNTNLESLAKVK